MKFLILNGPNINMLGLREPEIYGDKTYEDLINLIKDYADEKGVEVEFYQSNHEGDLVDKIQSARGVFDGIVFNPAAYTHTSVAILDATLSAQVPTVEVHISDPEKREQFRHTSFIRQACVKTICGMGLKGYLTALDFLIERGENA